jgi:hypothetical protein
LPPNQYITDDEGNVYLARGTQGAPVTGARGKAAGGVTREKAVAGANTAVESIDDAEALLAQNPEADVLPMGAALARGAKTSGGVVGLVGGVAEPLAQRSMTPPQQQFQADMQRMVHSMVGLLPGSRQSIVLFNSLVNAYTPAPGESPAARTAKRQARLRARHWLDAVRRGESIPIPPELQAAGITEADLPTGGAPATPAPRAPTAPTDSGPPPPAGPSFNAKFWHPNRP